MRRYKVTESQKSLFEELGRRRGVKEQEFIAQSAFSSPMGEATEIQRNEYTVNVTIVSGIDELGVKDYSHLDDKTYFKLIKEDVITKIEESFNSKEFIIHSISTKSRGELNELYAG